jgi:hypothetical protein
MMIHINRFAIAVVLLLGCSLSVVQSFPYSSLPSSKQRRSSTTRKQPHHHPQRRQAYSTLSAAPDDNKNSNKQDWSSISQKTVAACFLIASLWLSPIVLEQSHTFRPYLLSSHIASAKELTPNDLTKTYQRNTDAFIGGYTVTGTKLSLSPNNNKNPSSPTITESFTVAQECICSAKSTPHGIFATGANPENAFLFLATFNAKGNEWTAEQTSVGVNPAYKATMRFGKVAGGVHTAIGSTMGGGGQEVTAFSAEQSAMGCNEGVGASKCEAVCGKQGVSWDMIRRKCGL